MREIVVRKTTFHISTNIADMLQSLAGNVYVESVVEDIMNADSDDDHDMWTNPCPFQCIFQNLHGAICELRDEDAASHAEERVMSYLERAITVGLGIRLEDIANAEVVRASLMTVLLAPGAVVSETSEVIVRLADRQLDILLFFVKFMRENRFSPFSTPFSFTSFFALLTN